MICQYFAFLAYEMWIINNCGFPAELLIIMGALAKHIGVGLVLLFAIIVSTAYFLSIYRQAFLEPTRNDIVADADDLRLRELVIILVFLLVILAGGLYPQAVLDVTEATGTTWLANFH